MCHINAVSHMSLKRVFFFETEFLFLASPTVAQVRHRIVASTDKRSTLGNSGHALYLLHAVFPLCQHWKASRSGRLCAYCGIAEKSLLNGLHHGRLIQRTIGLDSAQTVRKLNCVLRAYPVLKQESNFFCVSSCTVACRTSSPTRAKLHLQGPKRSKRCQRSHI